MILNQIFAFLPGPIEDPVAIFLVMMAVLLIAPIVFEKIKLPGIVGLIIAGVFIGEYGLGILERDNTIELFSTVGLLFLMFMAGLETSLDDLKLNGKKATIFGLGTFLVPMIMGTIAFMLLDYSLLASILVASCFASHTLLALPIAIKQGIMRTPVVTIVLGGTLIVNIIALLVLAVIVKADQGELTLGFWLFLIPSLTIYTFATLFGLPILGRWFFKQFGRDEGAEFTFVIATLFVVSYVARLIEIEPIIGAFLAGIGIRPLIPQLSPLMNRIQFMGNTLFVPLFLISVGMLVNPMTLIEEPKSVVVSLVMIFAGVVGKFIPAWVIGKYFKFAVPSIMVMFGLSVAQAASTLAAITVAYDIELVDEFTVNGTIAMILVTSIISPWVTERYGGQLKQIQQKALDGDNTSGESFEEEEEEKDRAYRVLVPVANPNTEDNLLNLALLLVNATEGTLLPLNILVDQGEAISENAKENQGNLLATAEMIAHATATPVETIARIDSSIDEGIIHVAQERNANLIICGWKGFSTYRENLFGNIIDNLVNYSPVTVLITRFTKPIKNTQRVILAIADNQYNMEGFPEVLTITKALSSQLQSEFFILHVLSGKPSPMVNKNLAELPVQQMRGNFTKRVLQEMKNGDLLVLVNPIDNHLIGRSALGTVPRAIARSNEQISLMIVNIR
ncbi:cation:proton antiporter [Cyanobacterium stanieri LEGE 03274]|uniref:Cation:proton antiporter n=1 Tax=Cyanobacterium stanieri LEGE 03274 TaxID=1828756 RepID=A0ABR9V6I1_9CHRO|nr:cation:proton antiporter [Cyanobacterium stanieri]MBE9223487.1 cation:proton antiporter [Cyanobacterium stanieri LEGE 03274]